MEMSGTKSIPSIGEQFKSRFDISVRYLLAYPTPQEGTNCHSCNGWMMLRTDEFCVYHHNGVTYPFCYDPVGRGL